MIWESRSYVCRTKIVLTVWSVKTFSATEGIQLGLSRNFDLAYFRRVHTLITSNLCVECMELPLWNIISLWKSNTYVTPFCPLEGKTKQKKPHQLVVAELNLNKIKPFLIQNLLNTTLCFMYNERTIFPFVFIQKMLLICFPRVNWISP